MPRNNPAGKNGYGDKVYPPDAELKESLQQYARERLSVDERLDRLRVEHGLRIGKSKLMILNNKFDIPSARKHIPDETAVQAILEKVAADPAQRNGVGAIGTFLSNEGMPIARDFIRHVLSVHAPDGLAARFPGARVIPRSKLSAIGPFHQDHSDGHDKLNAQALKMGDISLPIYGIKDQWSSYIKHLVTIPDNRLATTIGHVHLDCVEKYHAIPITSVVDKGSEVVFLFANQMALRTTHAPDIDVGPYPPVLQVKSTKNTPIEGCWHWFLKTTGYDFRNIIQSGLQDGIYNPNNELHINLFKWLWPQILQCSLDAFSEYWNNHRIRSQPQKPNVSGTTPRQAFSVPESFSGKDCRITIDQNTIDDLRSQIPVSRDDAMRWVDDEFAQQVLVVYEAIGSPQLLPLSGWAIFSQLLYILQT